MSHELEELLAALYERDTASHEQRPECVRRLEELLAVALARHPGKPSRDELLAALLPRYRDYRRIRRVEERAKLSRVR